MGKYVFLADDDAWVDLKNFEDLVQFLPQQLVYMGSLVDTTIVQLPGMAEYYGTERIPLFAVGFGLLLSADLCWHIARPSEPWASRTQLKSRGFDDMGMGVWLNGVEALHKLHSDGVQEHPEAAHLAWERAASKSRACTAWTF